jgi:uncharacterized membrane protein
MSLLNRLTIILVLLSSFSLCLGALRMHLAENIKGLFLIWNLFLAWVPFLLSLLLCRSFQKYKWIVGIPLIGLWILFLPNAPYLITDLVHLKPRDGIPYWFDSSILFCFAFNGLLLGISSALLIHQEIRRYWNSYISWLFMISCFILSGYGIYLGRFLRWNSWDLFTNPVSLLYESIQKLQSPTAWLVTIIFSILLLLGYSMLYSLTQNQTHPKHN